MDCLKVIIYLPKKGRLPTILDIFPKTSSFLVRLVSKSTIQDTVADWQIFNFHFCLARVFVQFEGYFCDYKISMYR